MKKIIMIISIIIICFLCVLLKTNTITFRYDVEFENQLNEVEEIRRIKWYKSLDFPNVQLNNYDIIGWVDNNQEYIYYPSNVNNSIYTLVIEPKIYTIYFYENISDDTPIHSIDFQYGNIIYITYKADDTLTHTFDYWEDISQNRIDEVQFCDTNLYAHYSPKTFNINYELNGGNFKEEPLLNYTYGTEVESLPAPYKSEYEFQGWYLDENFENKIESISNQTYGDLTLYAKWKFIYTEGIYGRLTVGSYSAKLSSPKEYKGLTAQQVCDLSGVCYYGVRDNGNLIVFADHNTQGFLAIKNNTTAKWTWNGRVTHLKRISIYTGYNNGIIYYDDGVDAFRNHDGPIMMYTCIPGTKNKVYITFWDYT